MDSKIKVTSTCVRIPVLVSHSISVNVEFNKKYNLDEIKKCCRPLPDVKLLMNKRMEDI